MFNYVSGELLFCIACTLELWQISIIVGEVVIISEHIASSKQYNVYKFQ
jgi:hypothetical protein